MERIIVITVLYLFVGIFVGGFYVSHPLNNRWVAEWTAASIFWLPIVAVSMLIGIITQLIMIAYAIVTDR